jgi:hypothetical protein
VLPTYLPACLSTISSVGEFLLINYNEEVKIRIPGLLIVDLC